VPALSVTVRVLPSTDRVRLSFTPATMVVAAAAEPAA
jgi:hypothetical protein